MEFEGYHAELHLPRLKLSNTAYFSKKAADWNTQVKLDIWLPSCALLFVLGE